MLVGLMAAGLTLGVGQILLMIVRPIWARLLIALAFVVPAAIAGYHATHGIVKHTMPSETWQVAFSVVGAIAVSVTAFTRVAGMAASARPAGASCRPDLRSEIVERPDTTTAGTLIIDPSGWRR